MKASDFIGKRFGHLTVLEDSGQRQGSSILWRCRCDCGGEILAARHQLVSGNVTSCGCIAKPAHKPIPDLIGKRFGKLTVVGDSGQRDGTRSILWICRCDCGGEILAVRYQLESGNVSNCGCVPKQPVSKAHAEDLTGQRFGDLTVLRRAENDKHGRACWLCQCSCGNKTVVSSIRLKSGHTTSCGCKRHASARNTRDLTGQRFGRLTVLYRTEEKNRAQKSNWHCRCDCGNEIDVYAGSLLRGLTQSCGCWNREQGANFHDHMHYQDDTCLEMLKRAASDQGERTSKAGFRGLFLTKSGTYRVSITFQKVHYTLGYYSTFREAVQARLDAEEALHTGYINAFREYQAHAAADPTWAENNPFYYRATRIGKEFEITTNGFTIGGYTAR